MKILIISDKRAGHLNQSLAFAKYIDAETEVIDVHFRWNFLKKITYILDFFKIYTDTIFAHRVKNYSTYDYVVSTGSSTYYLNKLVAKRYNIQSIALMLPKGFRYDFDHIFAQRHDNPPLQDNITVMDVNFSYSIAQGLFQSKRESVGIIIGGKNSIYSMDIAEIKNYLDRIIELFQGYDIAVTTSPRTSSAIEDLVASYNFAYSVFFSKNRVNPIADFLEQCEYVFITQDSTSMISEAVSNGKASVEVLPLKSNKESKFESFVDNLASKEFLHIFDMNVTTRDKKVDCSIYAKEIFR